MIWAIATIFFSAYLRQIEIKSRSRFLKLFALEQNLDQGLVVVYVKEIANKTPRIIRINDKAKMILLKKGKSLSLLDLEA